MSVRSIETISQPSLRLTARGRRVATIATVLVATAATYEAVAFASPEIQCRTTGELQLGRHATYFAAAEALQKREHLQGVDVRDIATVIEQQNLDTPAGALQPGSIVAVPAGCTVGHKYWPF